MTTDDVLGALLAVVFVLLAWVGRVLWRLGERLARLEGSTRLERFDR